MGKNAGERARAAGLGKITNIVAKPASPLVSVVDAERARQTRDERYAARAMLSLFTNIKRVRLCGRAAVRSRGTVDVRMTDAGMAGFSGLGVCGSVWACPVCSAKIQAQRRTEIQQLVDWVRSTDRTMLFVTRTLRHRKDQSLELVWNTLQAASRAIQQARNVREARMRAGFHGYVKTVEVKVGGINGWHPHEHLIYVMNGEVTDEMIEAMHDAEYAVMVRESKRYGLQPPSRERGIDIQRVESAADLVDYMVKSDADDAISARAMRFEMSGTATKKSRGSGSRSPFEVLLDFTETKNADDLDLWLEYESVSRGRKSLTWSRGLKEEAGIGEVEDEEAAEQAELSDPESTKFVVVNWFRDLGHQSGLASKILTEMETKGVEAAIAFCHEWGIETGPPDHPSAVMDRIGVSRRANESRAAAAERAGLATEAKSDEDHDELMVELMAKADLLLDAVADAKRASRASAGVSA